MKIDVAEQTSFDVLLVTRIKITLSPRVFQPQIVSKYSRIVGHHDLSVIVL